MPGRYTAAAAQRMCDEFNLHGTRLGEVPVSYYPIRREDGSLGGTPFETTTRWPAYVDQAGQPVVFLHGKAGYVALDHCVRREG